MKVVTGTKEYFPGIGKIQFEGKESNNPLAFKWYDENKLIAGKTMKEHFRFAIAYWHTFCGAGNDPFGGPNLQYAWNNARMPLPEGSKKWMLRLNLSLKSELLIYCFHDFDLVDEGARLRSLKRDFRPLWIMRKRSKPNPA